MWDEIVGAQSCQEKRGGGGNRTESKRVRVFEGGGLRGRPQKTDTSHQNLGHLKSACDFVNKLVIAASITRTPSDR